MNEKLKSPTMKNCQSRIASYTFFGEKQIEEQMRRKGLNKIKNRKKLWDILGLVYGESAQYLWKNKHLKCNCSTCRHERFFKKYTRKQNRLKARKDLSQKYV